MSMLEFMICSIVEGSLAAFVLTLGYKWDIVYALQEKAKSRLMKELTNCQFCMTFWICVALSLVASVLTGEWVLMLAPMVATKIGLKLL